MSIGAVVREARLRHGLDQRTLARRARTTQTQISRIERDEISPSVATVERLLAVMGERLHLEATSAAASGDFPQAPADPADRLREAAELSFALTTIATRAGHH